MSWDDQRTRSIDVCSFPPDEHWSNLLFLFNSSSDSDSDPEGGELPDITYSKAEVVQRKKQKKKRSEKMIEERLQKINRKREVSDH